MQAIETFNPLPEKSYTCPELSIRNLVSPLFSVTVLLALSITWLKNPGRTLERVEAVALSSITNSAAALSSPAEVFHTAVLKEHSSPFAQTPSTSRPNLLELERKKGQVKFLAGLIAVHRPTIPDSGAVARNIVEISAKEGIDPFLVAAVISVESRFSTKAKSHVGATGLMQLMPRTAKALSAEQEMSLVDPETNIRLGIQYLKKLERRFDSDRFLALSAYNWGPTNVAKVGRNPQRVPSSVRRYASTVMDRAQNWRLHYLRAHQSAASISG